MILLKKLVRYDCQPFKKLMVIKSKIQIKKINKDESIITYKKETNKFKEWKDLVYYNFE